MSSPDRSGKLHFGNWIKERREKLEMTQATLAQRIGVSMATIRNWEHAERLPRISVAIKSALADALRMTAVDLEAVDRGEKATVAIAPLPSTPDARGSVRIENYERAKQYLRGVVTAAECIKPGGFVPHKMTPAHVKEFAWIIEDDSMEGSGGYSRGDIVFFVESKNIPAASDVMVEVQGQGLGVVRRIYYQDDRAILTALNKSFPPQLVPLKDVSKMAMAVAIFRAV